MLLQTRQASNAVLNSQEFFRLFQQLESGGDIYEIDTSVKALCVGPQSDLANYDVFFIDTQADDAIDKLALSVGNPTIGRLDALLATQFPTTDDLPARILVTPRDLVDNTFVPSSFNSVEGDFIAARPLPRIDLFAYLSDPAGLAPLRDDRLYSFPFISTASPADPFYILPYYGRRYCHIVFCNYADTAPAQTYTLTVLGINLSPGTQSSGGQTPGAPRACETPLATIVVAAGATQEAVFTLNDGLFDLITIQIEGTFGTLDPDSSLRVTVSDRT